MTKLRVVGDCHGKINKLIDLADQGLPTICVGDVAFNYYWLDKLAPSRLRVLLGNHDNYDNPSKLSLGDYGIHEVPGWGSFFFVRGAFSLDYKFRTPKVDWWPEQEELSDEQMERCFEEYVKAKPLFVITHDAPLFVIEHMGLPPINPAWGWDIGPQRTPKLLQRMWVVHQPRAWFYGHFHRSFDKRIGPTRFRCLNELENEDVEFPCGSDPAGEALID